MNNNNNNNTTTNNNNLSLFLKFKFNLPTKRVFTLPNGAFAKAISI